MAPATGSELPCPAALHLDTPLQRSPSWCLTCLTARKPQAWLHSTCRMALSCLCLDMSRGCVAAALPAACHWRSACLHHPARRPLPQLLLCKFSHVTGNKFLHGHSKQVYTVDHLTGEVADPEVPPAPTFRDDVEGLRVALETALVASVATTFDCSQKNSVGISVLPSVDGLRVVVSAKKSRLTAFWAGRWLATFSVKNIAPGSADISGRVDVVTHYYESGNVQLRSDKSWELVGVTGGGDAGLAAALVSQIEQWSAEYQAALDTMIASMGGSLKSLRRALPLTGSKMSWNLAQHANVGMLKGVASAAAGK